MHFVFVVGSYYPYYSAVGKCVGNVADVLSQRHKVTIICEKNNSDQEEEYYYNNQRILRIVTKDITKRIKIVENINRTRRIKKKFYNLSLGILKLEQAAELVFSKTSVKSQLVDSFLSKLLDINENIDVIIPACMPFESVVAAYKYKEIYNAKVHLVPYLFDQFVENELLHRLKVNKRIKRKKHMKIEKEVISNSNTVLIMKQLKNYLLSNYSEYNHLFQEVEHPLIVERKKKGIQVNKKTAIFTYAGSFYKGIRDPEYMLKIFDLYLEKNEGILNLYTFGNYNNIIKAYAYKNDLIKDNGSLASTLVAGELEKADFLVAVGNSVSNQVPSKVFEYLSFGKPIIYFYELDNDSNVEILKNYPYGLCIRKNAKEIEGNIFKLKKFCEENKDRSLTFEEISKLFPDALPEYTANLLENVILNQNQR